jgi:septal ring factor EnvC (AmiA/AmiB activator)
MIHKSRIDNATGDVLTCHRVCFTIAALLVVIAAFASSVYMLRHAAYRLAQIDERIDLTEKRLQILERTVEEHAAFQKKLIQELEQISGDPTSLEKEIRSLDIHR